MPIYNIIVIHMVGQDAWLDCKCKQFLIKWETFITQQPSPLHQEEPWREKLQPHIVTPAQSSPTPVPALYSFQFSSVKYLNNFIWRDLDLDSNNCKTYTTT